MNPSQLYCTFPLVYDQDVTSPHAIDSHSEMGDTSTNHQGELLEVDVAQDYRSVQSDYCMSLEWPIENRRGTPSGLSWSDSPGPDNPISHPVQSHKRKAQNRAAQRAYRDRKMRYLQELQSGLQEIEQQISRLQNENTDLIRQLCEMRAANNDLRNRGKCYSAETSRQNTLASFSSGNIDGPAEAWSKANFSEPVSGELQALYEPFAAMCNLIHLDPSVARGTVTAETVLDRLKAIVEFSSARRTVQPAQAPASPAIPV